MDRVPIDANLLAAMERAIDYDVKNKLRVERLWEAVAGCEYAKGMTASMQFVSVVKVLEAAGIDIPGLDLTYELDTRVAGVLEYVGRSAIPEVPIGRRTDQRRTRSHAK